MELLLQKEYGQKQARPGIYINVMYSVSSYSRYTRYRTA